MIKNIIFDLGNVLIEYSPERFISEFVARKIKIDSIKEYLKSKSGKI